MVELTVKTRPSANSSDFEYIYIDIYHNDNKVLQEYYNVGGGPTWWMKYKLNRKINELIRRIKLATTVKTIEVT